MCSTLLHSFYGWIISPWTDMLQFLSLVSGQLSCCLPFARYEHCGCEHLCTRLEHLFSICFVYVPRRGIAASWWLLLADCDILHAHLQCRRDSGFSTSLPTLDRSYICMRCEDPLSTSELPTPSPWCNFSPVFLAQPSLLSQVRFRNWGLRIHLQRC